MSMVYRISVTVVAIALALVFAVNCGSSKKTIDAPPGGGSVDASNRIDAAIDAPGGGTVGVPCGSASCTGGDVCCVGSGGSRTCVGSGSGMCMGASFACDGASDCSNGDVCCFTGGTGGGFGTQCEAGSACRFQACNGSAECMTGSATMCCPLGSSGLSACRARCL
jgi:hypothetical protein